MKKLLLCSSLLVLFSIAAVAQNAPAAPQSAAQNPPPAATQPKTVAAVMDRMLSGVEREFVSAAEAMPEDKYSFAPSNGEFKGVRTFAQQVKHVAATNYMIFSAMLDEKAPEVGENGPDTMTSKADIVKYLKDSFALGHRAIAAMNTENLLTAIRNPFGGQGTATRLGTGTLVVGHCFDHYGQMVEYLRMNGIVPPASRGQ